MFERLRMRRKKESRRRFGNSVGNPLGLEGWQIGVPAKSPMRKVDFVFL